jgi:hypothetical protein
MNVVKKNSGQTTSEIAQRISPINWTHCGVGWTLKAKEARGRSSSTSTPRMEANYASPPTRLYDSKII